MCVFLCSAVGCFSHAAALLWFPSAKKWLTAIFPNERFTMHQLGRVSSRCTGSLEFKSRQVLEFLARLHPSNH